MNEIAKATMHIPNEENMQGIIEFSFLKIHACIFSLTIRPPHSDASISVNTRATDPLINSWDVIEFEATIYIHILSFI